MLQAAHRGYEYQDLMVAIKLPDLLLGSLTSLTAETKLYEGDLFDDLMITDTDGRRSRIQIKTPRRRPEPCPPPVYLH